MPQFNPNSFVVETQPQPYLLLKLNPHHIYCWNPTSHERHHRSPTLTDTIIRGQSNLTSRPSHKLCLRHIGNRYPLVSSLQQRQLSILASQITVLNSLFVNSKGNITDPHHCPVCDGDSPATGGFPELRTNAKKFPRVKFSMLALSQCCMYHHVLTLTMAVILWPSVTTAGQNVLRIGHITTMALQTHCTERRHVRFHVDVLTVSNDRRRPTIHAYGVTKEVMTLQWRHNDNDSVSNHQPYDCLLNRLFGRRSK